MATDPDLCPVTDSPSPDSPVTPTEFLERDAFHSNDLTPEEESYTDAFLATVNSWRSNRGYEPLVWNVAVKFLMARKFHLERALALYQQHELMRIKEGLTSFDADSSPLKEELSTGKFTILPTRDSNGATIALFNAHKHEPSQTTHRTTLQGVVYQLDKALEDISTQRGGLVFIYNMSGSKYSNFDYDLSQKMLTLLKGAYPARLKKVLIVTAPLWFKAPFKVLRLFVREKLRDRVFTVSWPQLHTHIPPESIPKEIGGSLEWNQEWLSNYAESRDKKAATLITMTAGTPETPDKHEATNQPTLEQLEAVARSDSISNTNGSSFINNKIATNVLTKLMIESPSLAVNSNSKDNPDVNEGHNLSDEENNVPIEDSKGMPLNEFVEHVKAMGRRGLYEEYSEIKNRPPLGTFKHSKAFENQWKNRYTDVLCFDHTRVTLSEEDGRGDYINANFVDGYKQPKAFISSQGPLPKTFPDFWKMVWEQQVLVIVMTTKTIERQRTKCGQYWPEDIGNKLIAGVFEIHSEEAENCGEDFVMTRLILKYTPTGETRHVCHFQFVSWPDYGVPDSALSMLNFLSRVREKQAEMLKNNLGAKWIGHYLGPPIIVHCSAGIGRTGTFATLDIAIRKFEDIGRIDIQATVEKIRTQRAFSIQMPDQYVFCHLAFLEYILSKDYLEEIDLTGFDDDCDSC